MFRGPLVRGHLDMGVFEADGVRVVGKWSLSESTAVDFQEHVCRGECRPLVAILKGVVFDDFLRQACSKLVEIFLTLVVLPVHGRCDCRLQQVGLRRRRIGDERGIYSLYHLRAEKPMSSKTFLGAQLSQSMVPESNSREGLVLTEGSTKFNVGWLLTVRVPYSTGRLPDSSPYKTCLFHRFSVEVTTMKSNLFGDIQVK